jgi:hypothetical protein
MSDQGNAGGYKRKYHAKTRESKCQEIYMQKGPRIHGRKYRRVAQVRCPKSKQERASPALMVLIAVCNIAVLRPSMLVDNPDIIEAVAQLVSIDH